MWGQEDEEEDGNGDGDGDGTMRRRRRTTTTTMMMMMMMLLLSLSRRDGRTMFDFYMMFVRPFGEVLTDMERIGETSSEGSGPCSKVSSEICKVRQIWPSPFDRVLPALVCSQLVLAYLPLVWHVLWIWPGVEPPPPLWVCWQASTWRRTIWPT
jgi:hypothetical protein